MGLGATQLQDDLVLPDYTCDGWPSFQTRSCGEELVVSTSIHEFGGGHNSTHTA